LEKNITQHLYCRCGLSDGASKAILDITTFILCHIYNINVVISNIALEAPSDKPHLQYKCCVI
jgi:hypothetical protein